MDQKMKNFDRRIEQMMNENEVSPPFGMWNRIAAEIEVKATAIPPSVNSPLPQRRVYAFIAGALLISSSLLTAYLVNNISSEEKTATLDKVSGVEIYKSKPVLSEIPTIVFREETKNILRRNKSKSASALITENPIANPIQASVSTLIIPTHAEIMIPNQNIAESNNNSETYFFPAIDVNSSSSKPDDKPTASIVKSSKIDSKTIDDNEREISSYEPPRIKFRPKKHRTFSYGKIIHRK